MTKLSPVRVPARLLLALGLGACVSSTPVHAPAVVGLPRATPVSESRQVTSAARRRDDEAAATLARKRQDPLASIHGLLTDSAIGFNSGTRGAASFGFQFQPVYAVDFEDQGFSLIPRALVPLLGLEPGTDVPPVGIGLPTDVDRTWGLGDVVLQTLYAPHTTGAWKWGVGPQLSLPTATDELLQGPDLGAGFTAAVPAT